LEQVRLQLLADEIKPAEARRAQMVEEARGRAAKVVEEGKATASALLELAATWRSSGSSAREIVVAQKLSSLIGTLMSTVPNAPINKVTFIDSKLAGGNDLAVKAAITSEQLKHTMGIDVPAILNKISGGASPATKAAFMDQASQTIVT
jgi:flotillin